MQVSHKVMVQFDEASLVSWAGLVPALELARRAGLHDLLTDRVSVPGPAGANTSVKVTSLVAAMLVGADCIQDTDVLRHGGMGRVFTAGRAATTLGTHLRAYRFGHVRQVDAVAARFLTGLAGRVPGLVAGGGQRCFVDIDDTMRETHGYSKQGVAYGYSKVKGLNAQLAVISGGGSAPVIAGVRLRRGNIASAHGAARLVGDALAVARRAGVCGRVTVRADSAYYGYALVAAASKGGALFSVTARMDPKIARAIATIDEDSWVGIQYPQAIFDDEQQRWISDAQVAEVLYTAFTSRRKAEHVTARLIVRRVKRLNPKHVPAGQGELFPTWRHHMVFTNSQQSMLDAEAEHRDHAIVEQVIADLKDGPLAHLPSGVFTANAAWTVIATMAFNLTRAVGVLASTRHARSRGATIRRQLINLPARIARSARRIRLHLPEHWPWQEPFTQLFTATCGPPAAAVN
jgi:hypothetical protein